MAESGRNTGERADELAEIAATRPADLADHVEELGELLDADDGYVRGRAMRSIARLSEEHPGAVVDLVDPLTESLGDEHLRDDAALALGNVARADPEAVLSVLPALVSVLDEEGTVRANATYALAGVAEADPESLAAGGVLDRLFSLCADDSAEVRMNATRALGDIATADAAAVCEGADALADRLDDDVPEVRRNAAHTLGTAGPDCPGAVVDAVDNLVELLGDSDAGVRAAAAYALGAPARGSGDGEAAVEALRAHVHDESPAVRRHVTYALSVVARDSPDAARPAIESLVRRTADEDGTVRRNALAALSTLESEFPRGVEDARSAFADTLESLDENSPAAFSSAQLQGLADEATAPQELRSAADRALTLVDAGAAELDPDGGETVLEDETATGEDEGDGESTCPNCGEPVDPDGVFCPECGSQIG